MGEASDALRLMFDGVGFPEHWRADAKRFLDAALAEAREEGRREGLDQMTQQAAEDRKNADWLWAQRGEVRREAFGEAAQVCAEIATETENPGANAGATTCKIRVLALADQPPPLPRPSVEKGIRSVVATWEEDEGLKVWVDYFDGERELVRFRYEAKTEVEPERDVECLCGNNVGAICPLHSSTAP